MKTILTILLLLFTVAGYSQGWDVDSTHHIIRSYWNDAKGLILTDEQADSLAIEINKENVAKGFIELWNQYINDSTLVFQHSIKMQNRKQAEAYDCKWNSSYVCKPYFEEIDDCWYVYVYHWTKHTPSLIGFIKWLETKYKLK